MKPVILSMKRKKRKFSSRFSQLHVLNDGDELLFTDFGKMKCRNVRFAVIFCPFIRLWPVIKALCEVLSDRFYMMVQTKRVKDGRCV